MTHCLTRLLLMLVLLAFIIPGQTPLSTRPPSGPPFTVYEELYYRDGSNNIEYVCIAAAVQNTAGPTIFHRTAASSRAPLGGTAANLTSIADAANTATATTSAAHGLRVGQRVTVAGATVDTDLNGVYTILTVPTTTTFTFTTASVTDDTYVEATLNLSTRYTRDSQLAWAIQKFFYTGTNIDRGAWARAATSTTEGSPTVSFSFACASRTTYF